jgi:DNA-binding HxlR family transcriptional regulator
MKPLSAKKRKKRSSMGIDQYEKKWESFCLIDEALHDGKWHRILDLQGTSHGKHKLSTKTLYKQLRELEKSKIIQRKEGKEKGKYAVYYRVCPELQLYLKFSGVADGLADTMVKPIREGADPLVALESINNYVELCILTFIYYSQKDKEQVSKDILSSYLKLWIEEVLWRPYRKFTQTLMEETLKVIDNIDIAEIATNQRLRASESAEENAQSIYNMFGVFDKREAPPSRIISPEDIIDYFNRKQQKHDELK